MMSFFLHIKISTPKPLKLKFERQEKHEILMNIRTKNDIFVNKLFDKRDKFAFFIVWMPYLSNNILSSIFYGSMFSGSYE